MTLRANFLPVVAALFAALLVSSVAHAQSADALIQEGLELRRQTRDAEALQRFQDAYNLSQSAQALAQIALAEQALGNYVEAEIHLQSALATQDPWIATRRPALQEALGQISAQLGTIEISGGVPGAQVFVNGIDRGTFPQAARIRARAGSAVIEIRAQGYLTVQRTVMVMAGGTARESVQLVASGGAVVQPTPYVQPGGGGGYYQQPAQVQYENQPIWGLFWAGLPVFLAPYLITGITVFTINPSYAEEQAFGFIPIVGPFLLLDYISDDTGLGYTFLILDGIVQAAGIVMMVLGLTLTREVAVRAELGDQPDAPTLTFTPLAGPDTVGGALTLTHF